MHDYFDKYSKLIPIIMIVLLISLGILVAYSFRDKGDISSTGVIIASDGIEGHSSKVNDSKEYDHVILGVVKGINTEKKTITIMDVAGNLDVILSFNGGTDIRDKYNKIISISQIAIGEMVDTFYQQDSSKLVKLQISKDAWEYQGVGNLTIKKADRVMEIADSRYQYDDRLVIAGEGELINLMDINDKDELTIKGVGEKIWSIIVTKGHGYIRLKNYEDFVNGSIEVGYDIMIPIVKDMLIVAREGDYKITLEKDELKGSKHINVLRDQEIILDMSEYRKEVKKVGSVDFLVQPYGGLLYVDGKEADYEDPIELIYGEHVIEVKLRGYSSYLGMLEVDESSKIVSINLAEEVMSEDLTVIANDQDTKESNNTNNAAISVEEEDLLEEEEDGDIEESKGDNELQSNDIKSNGSNTNDSNTSNSNTNNSNTNNTNTNDSNAENSSNEENSQNRTIDINHKITIEKPVGFEVYLNGNLKGTTPCSFSKQIGSQTISFRKDGYVTKSYTVEVEDNSQNIKFSFPEMEKRE